MKSRAAVAFGPGQPLKIVEIDVAPPKKGEVLVDLDYEEDSSCDVDMNFVMLENKQIVEMQGTAEKGSFSMEQAQTMMVTATQAMDQIFAVQKAALSS